MCATIIWAVNQAAFTDEFRAATTERLGVEPQPTEFRIASGRVRRSAAHFTLTRNMCDCDGLVGLRDDPLRDDETNAQALLAWIRELPEISPHVARLAILRAWSPQDWDVRPQHARSVTVDEVDEARLRGVLDDSLLTIDYPHPA